MKQTLQMNAQSLSAWEVITLLLTTAAAMVRPQIWPLAIVVPLVFWAARRVINHRFLPATPYNSLLLAILLLIAVGSILFPYSLSSGKAVLLALSIALFVALTHLMQVDSDSIMTVIYGIILLGLGMASFGFLFADWPPPFSFINGLRTGLPEMLSSALGSIEVGTNELAGVIGWIIPLLIALLIGIRRAPGKTSPAQLLAVLLATLFCSILLLATASRGGIFAASFGVAVVLALIVEPRWRVAVAASAVVALLVIYFTYSNPQLAGSGVEDAVGMRGRLEIWQRALETLSALPLTGIGVNSFRWVAPTVYPLFATPPEIDIAHSHNQVLQAGLDLGIIGMAAYVAIWVLTVALLVQIIRTMHTLGQTSHPFGLAAIGLAGSFTAGWVFGLVDAVALGARPGFLWWAMLAVISGIHHEVVVRRSVGVRQRRRKGTAATEPDMKAAVGTDESIGQEESTRPLPHAPFAPQSSPRIQLPRPHGERPPLPESRFRQPESDTTLPKQRGEL